MHLVSIIVMILGVIGFALSYAAIINFGPLALWGGLAVGGMVFTVMTRRSNN